MPTTIKLKNSVTTTNVPSSLAQGEVAINVTDKKVWVGNAATTPVQLLGGGADGTFTNVSVSGVASFADGTVSLPSITNIGDTNTGIYFPAADTIAFSEGGVESMRIDSSGNVGIGTASPSTKLHVAGTGTQGITVERTDAATAGLFQLLSGSSTNVINASTAKPISVEINGSERMRIASDGNVGIGTSSPAQKLHVSGTGDTRLQVESTSSGGGIIYLNGSNAGFAAYNTIQSRNGSTVQWAIGGSGDQNTLPFYTNASERMRIDSSGRLLVGRTSTVDSSKLTVENNDATVGVFFNTNASNISTVLQARATRNTTNNSFYAFTYYNEGAGADKLRIADSGNVTNTNNSYGSISDIKLKENIVDATPKLEKICQVKVRNFNIIGDAQKQIGVVAQELEQVFPNMVEESPDRDVEGNDLGTTTKQVKYSVFVPMLIKAIQEQQAIITDLKSRIEALESK